MPEGLKTDGSDLTRWLLAALMAVTVLVYLRGLTGQFVWDDRLFFLDNDILPSWRPWDIDRILFQSSTYWRDHIPATNFLFTLEYNLFGRWTPGYHAVSLLLYLATGVLVYRLSLLVYGLADQGDSFAARGDQEWGVKGSALIVTAFFMFHPVHVEVVSYITGQKDLLYGFFSLLALYGLAVFSSGRASGRDPDQASGQVSDRSGRIWLLVAAISYYLAFMSKAMAIATALFLPVFWIFVLRRRGEGLVRPAVFWMALNLPAFAWVLYSISTSVDLLAQFSSASLRVFLGIKVLGAHVSVFLLPWPLNFGYPFNESGSFDPNMLMGIVFLGVMAISAGIRPRSLATLGMLAFFIFMLPVLQVFVRVQNAVIFDRYLYLAIFGGAIVFERFMASASMRMRPRAALLAALGVLTVLASLTVAYVPKFQSDVASLRHAYTSFRGWDRPAFDYAYALIEAGELDEAERVTLSERTFDRPGWVRPYFLGWIVLERGRPYDSLGYLELASYDAMTGGYFPFPDVPLGKAYMTLGKKGKAAAALRRVTARRTQNPLEFYKAKVMLEAMEAGDAR